MRKNKSILFSSLMIITLILSITPVFAEEDNTLVTETEDVIENFDNIESVTETEAIDNNLNDSEIIESELSTEESETNSEETESSEETIEIIETDISYDDQISLTSDDGVIYATPSSGVFKTSSNAYPISIDGYFDDWGDKAYSFEYNWDNSQNCWQWGVWVDGVCYKTPEGTYSTDVRHKMQLYCDGEYVYLHIVFSRDYGAKFNGEDYQFWFDDNMAAFQVEWPGGGTITGNLENTSPGIYPVEVRHRNSSMSYEVADGSSAYLKVNPDNLNNEIELKIPLSECVRQNGSIDIEHLSTIEFFTPNLMYRRITCTGTPIGPSVFIFGGLIILGVVSGFYFKNKRKKMINKNV